MEDLESGNLSYVTVVKFSLDLKEKFGEGDDKIIKVVKLNKMKQEEKIIKELGQKFRRVTRGSSYKERPLVEELKKGMNRVIRQKLIELEYPIKY